MHTSQPPANVRLSMGNSFVKVAVVLLYRYFVHTHCNLPAQSSMASTRKQMKNKCTPFCYCCHLLPSKCTPQTLKQEREALMRSILLLQTFALKKDSVCSCQFLLTVQNPLILNPHQRNWLGNWLLLQLRQWCQLIKFSNRQCCPDLILQLTMMPSFNLWSVDAQGNLEDGKMYVGKWSIN